MKMLGVLLAGAMVLGGCGSTEKKQEAGSRTIPELKIAISPYQDADTLRTKNRAFGEDAPGQTEGKGL